jgi:hypothetical protein
MATILLEPNTIPLKTLTMIGSTRRSGRARLAKRCQPARGSGAPRVGAVTVHWPAEGLSEAQEVVPVPMPRWWTQINKRVFNPAELRRGTGFDDDLAESVALTDVCQCLGDVVEAGRAVDVDLDLAGDASLGEGREVVWALLDHQQPDAAPGEPAEQGADRHDPQERRHRPTHAAVPTATGQRTSIREHRPGRNEVEDVIERCELREVRAAVVDHLVGAQRPHELELARVVDAGHVRPRALGELDRERPAAAACPVDEYPLAIPHLGGSLQGDRPA